MNSQHVGDLDTRATVTLEVLISHWVQWPWLLRAVKADKSHHSVMLLLDDDGLGDVANVWPMLLSPHIITHHTLSLIFKIR